MLILPLIMRKPASLFSAARRAPIRHYIKINTISQFTNEAPPARSLRMRRPAICRLAAPMRDDVYAHHCSPG